MIQELFAFILVSTLNDAFISYLPLIKGADFFFALHWANNDFSSTGAREGSKIKTWKLGLNASNGEISINMKSLDA